MHIFESVLLILCFNSLVTAKCHREREKYDLEQLQVLFRHGDRTPTIYDLYQGDPYEDIYREYGLGQLTEIGKEREFRIGQILRERYDAFLGDYRNEAVYAYSSDMDRTKMSLQLVLAGLYPPTPSTSWSHSVNWQPIPTHYEPLDSSFLSAIYLCPDYQRLNKAVASTPEILETYHQYQNLFQRITNNTGVTISTLFTALFFYSDFRSALSLGLPLPPWTYKEDFNDLEKIAAVIFKTMTQTEQLRRMIAGPVVEQFLKVLNSNDNSKKVYLYSASDYNIASFVNAHNITGAPGVPDYGSALILEKLRGPDSRSYVRMYLWTGVSETLIPLKIDNCEKVCPLSDYEKIVQPILPNDATRVCHSAEDTCERRRRTSAAREYSVTPGTAGNIDLDLELARMFAGDDFLSFKYTKDFLSYTVERS